MDDMLLVSTSLISQVINCILSWCVWNFGECGLVNNIEVGEVGFHILNSIWCLPHQ